VRDPLSIQYVDSNFNGGAGPRWAGRVGSLPDFAAFYRATGKAVPRSNPNADYQAGDAIHADWCNDYQQAWVAASSIGMNPYYPIINISARRVETTGSREKTIARIQALLDQGRAVHLSFVWQSSLDLSAFQIFWNTESEEAVYYPTMWLDVDADDGYYHEMCVVGYDDTDSDNRYWVVLNSWGMAGGRRPNGTFRMNMDIDYTSKAATWTTLDVTFGPRSLAPAGLDQDPAVLAVPGGSGVPTDMDADGTHEDVNGNGRADFADVVLFFNEMAWIAANEPVECFDFNGNGRVDFADAVQLFNRV
jgi:PKD repeat protein